MIVKTDTNKDYKLKIDVVIKKIFNTEIWLAIFYLKHERITVEDTGDVALISSVHIKDRVPRLIGIIRDGQVKLDVSYQGEARIFTKYIYILSQKLQTLKSGGYNELDIPKDSLQENRT